VLGVPDGVRQNVPDWPMKMINLDAASWTPRASTAWRRPLKGLLITYRVSLGRLAEVRPRPNRGDDTFLRRSDGLG